MNPTAPNPANNSAKVAGSGTGAAAISKAIPVVENVNEVNPNASTNVYSVDSALFPVPELNEAPVTVTVPSVRRLNLSGEPQRNVNDVTGAAKLIVPVLEKPGNVLSTEKLATVDPAGAKGFKKEFASDVVSVVKPVPETDSKVSALDRVCREKRAAAATTMDANFMS